jgi:hypothetical protein
MNFLNHFSARTCGRSLLLRVRRPGKGMSCEYFSSASGGGVSGPNGVVGAPTIYVNTTISNTLQVNVQMSVANAGDSVTEQNLKAITL